MQLKLKLTIEVSDDKKYCAVDLDGPCQYYRNVGTARRCVVFESLLHEDAATGKPFRCSTCRELAKLP